MAFGVGAAAAAAAVVTVSSLTQQQHPPPPATTSLSEPGLSVRLPSALQMQIPSYVRKLTVSLRLQRPLVEGDSNNMAASGKSDELLLMLKQS